MIKVDRNKVERPSFFSSKEYASLQNEIIEFYGIHKKTRSQRSFSPARFPDSVFDTLVDVFDNKCAYCESYLLRTKMFSSYDRFRPKENTQGFSLKEIDLDHYWWLTYQWENLYTCCPACKRYKSNTFPVDGNRAKIQTPYEKVIKREKAYLVDPCVDNPEEYFRFDYELGEIVPKDHRIDAQIQQMIPTKKAVSNTAAWKQQKAEVTIQILGLNRTELIDTRLQIIEQLNKELDSLQKRDDKASMIASAWEDIIDGNSTKEHLFLHQSYITDLLGRKENSGLLEYYTDRDKSFYEQIQQQAQQSQQYIKDRIEFPAEVSAEESNQTKEPVKLGNLIFDKKDGEMYASLLKNVYLDKIELKNFKCFSNLTIELPNYAENADSEPWLVFLGENGVGKSSVMKAVAIALMGQKYLDTLELEVSSLLKYGESDGHIRVYGKGKGEFFEVTFNKKQNRIKANIQNPSAFMIGYGSTRLLPIGNLQPEKNHPNYLKVKNLFDPSVSLSNAKNWLLNVERKTFDQVAKTLKNLLLLDDMDSIHRSKVKNRLTIQYHITKEIIDINHLSDGYKSIFAIAIDMIYTLSKENIVYSLAEGIVLIDEIGTHLHPRWKMEIIERLRNTFPKIQFIITTHEPLCLRGLKEHEVVVLKRNDRNTIDAIIDLPDPSSLRVDQLLTSEYFGLNSTMDAKTEQLFKEYYDLLAIDESQRTEEDKKEIERLKKLIPQKKRLGEDAREDLIYHAIDELLAKQVKEKNLKIVDDGIKKETISKVQNLWKNISAKNKL